MKRALDLSILSETPSAHVDLLVSKAQKRKLGTSEGCFRFHSQG